MNILVTIGSQSFLITNASYALAENFFSAIPVQSRFTDDGERLFMTGDKTRIEIIPPSAVPTTTFLEHIEANPLPE